MAKLTLALALIATAGGCETASNWLQGRPAGGDDTVILGAPDAAQYIDEMYALASGDPATQAEIYADANSAAALTPNPSTRLRYALVLATAGHAGADPAESQRILRDLLAQTELMTSAEIALATINLRSVEAQLTLRAESKRLSSASSSAASSEQARTARRLAGAEAENKRLRESLAEAEAKLKAITSIEREIRGQGGNN